MFSMFEFLIPTVYFNQPPTFVNYDLETPLCSGDQLFSDLPALVNFYKVPTLANLVIQSFDLRCTIWTQLRFSAPFTEPLSATLLNLTFKETWVATCSQICLMYAECYIAKFGYQGNYFAVFIDAINYYFWEIRTPMIFLSRQGRSWWSSLRWEKSHWSQYNHSL